MRVFYLCLPARPMEMSNAHHPPQINKTMKKITFVAFIGDVFYTNFGLMGTKI